jgi:LuxR family maltose regulon positive regulatory protein
MLAEIYWRGMSESFQYAVWLGWAKQLPEELIRSRPVLCTQIAWGYMDISEVDASESRLRDAERCLENPPDGMVVVVEEQFRALPARIAMVRTYNAQSVSDFPAAVKYAELALKLAPEEDHFMRAQTKAILGGTYWANGDLDAACKSMSDWIENAQKAGNFAFAIASASGKADILTEQGHLREALKTYQGSLQLATEHAAESQRIIAHHHLGLALLYHEMREDETAAQHFQKGMELGQQSVLRDWSYRKYLAQARLKESEGDLDSALDLLDEAKRYYARSLIPNTHPVDAIKTKIHLKQGRLPKAEEWVREQGLSANDGLNYVREFEHITLARVLIAEYQNNREERLILDGLHLLERLLKVAEDQNRMGSVLQILMVAALAHHAAGSTTQAFASLERTLRLAQPEGYFRTFVDEGEPMRALLSAFRTWIEKQPRSQYQELHVYTGKLLSAYAQPAGTAKPAPSMVEALSQRELEVLRLIAQGLSNNEISQKLFLALNTVKGHNRIIFNKLQVQNRTEAVARARELGLL